MAIKRGRNAPCHCGSGQKYKRCHLAQDERERGKVTLHYEISGSIGGGLPGSHADLILSPTGAPSKGPYSVIFTLMRPGQPPTPPEVLVGHEQLPGSSQLLFAMPGKPLERRREIYFHDKVASHEFVVHAIPDAEGRLAKLRIDNIEAPTYQDARVLAAAIMNNILSSLAFMYDIPLDVFRVDVADESTSNQHISVRMPFTIGVWDVELMLGKDLNKCAALYREGLGSSSDLYAFLCFFKIIEAIEGLNALDTTDARQRGEQPPKHIRHVMPGTDDEVRELALDIFPAYYIWNSIELSNIAPRETRGQKFFVIRDKHLTPLRHAIAHGLLNAEGLIDVDDPNLHEQVKYWLPCARFIARRMLAVRFLPTLLQSPGQSTAPAPNSPQEAP